MLKRISILGSTGSVGTQALRVIEANTDKIRVTALSAGNNIDLLEKQIKTFDPEVVCVLNIEKAAELRSRLGGKIPVLSGLEGLIEAASHENTDLVLTAVPGMIGLLPTLAAIDNGIDIALANKETLVAGGELVMKKAAEKNVNIYPVDSEHSAIFQCMMGNSYKSIHKIILTASGGPFIGCSYEELKNVTVEKALKHPNWSMGRKITIDSSTLMNKGLEVIEARWLFDLEPDQIEVVVHPQSIIHSLVEFNDHSTMAQLGYPDMRVPIQLAMFYPERLENKIKSLNLAEIGALTFHKPDMDSFKCLSLAFDALKIGGSMPAVLNASNEIMVERFLNREIGFLQIPEIIQAVMKKHNPVYNFDLDTLLEIDNWARRISLELQG
ncbi:MAG: 1-deoxy-D-xylulose-5-phosphate reductoisomerase [Eubacteriaceae bacterium]|nr:1-deoxy-D-xylulose-5-phosphate reductoisomerase [Eubacteriaceae bacterium]